MAWVSHADKPHQCKPPVEPAYTDVNFIDRCAAHSWQDIWRCDDCGKHWTPRPSVFPFHSTWVELKGWKLRWRLMGLK